MSVTLIEGLLSEWFGRPVVLMASGRTGLRIVLEHMGLDRYKHRIRVPRYVSHCVMSAVIWHGFPVLDDPADVTLVYHQFGFPQKAVVSGPVIEDVAHAFYATADTGARDWLGDFAIFSLPKWFDIAGMAGGVICRTVDQADELRDIMKHPKSYPEPLFRYPHPITAALEGMPGMIGELQAIGKRRAVHAAAFREQAKNQPGQLWDDVIVPWRLPYLPSTKAGFDRIPAGRVWHVDVARNMNEPNYKRCVLLPACD